MMLANLITISNVLANIYLRRGIDIDGPTLLVIVIFSGGLGIFYIIYFMFTTDIKIGKSKTDIITWILLILFVILVIFAVFDKLSN